MKNLLTRFIGRRNSWSIGIYTGDSPYHLIPPKGIKNPVLTAKNVTDRKALYIADPFMSCEQGIWYMFFEVLDRNTEKGEIGVATSSDGWRWSYRQIVLSELFHLSYPYIFKWQGVFYMIPESAESKAIRLYKATSFPYRWEFIDNLITDSEFLDSSVFYYNNRWWLFTCPSTNNDILKLFFASDLRGPWHEHPASPIVRENAHIARCGGRITVWGEKIIRYAQDDSPVYGHSLRTFEITKLTINEYEEREDSHNSLLNTNRKKWNKIGMHCIDPHLLSTNKWIACLDGQHKHIELRRGIRRI